MKRRHLLATLLLTPLLLFVIFFSWLVLPVLSDPADDFMLRKGHVQYVDIERVLPLGKTTITEATLHSSSGLSVKLSYRVPLVKQKKLPLLFILGGHHTGRDAVRVLPDSQQVILAAISYPYRGLTRVDGLGSLVHLREYQRAFRDTPSAVLLALDYLTTLAMVDVQRIEAIGVSLGAFLIAGPVAMDKRVKRLWLVDGGAKPDMVIAHIIRHKLHNRLLRSVVAKTLMLLVSGHYLKTERWLAQISPRPVIAINARQDERLPLASVTALHRALVSPSEIIWMEGLHISSHRKALVEKLSEIILARIATESEIKSPDSVAK